jgi:hypothetical protein
MQDATVSEEESKVKTIPLQIIMRARDTEAEASPSFSPLEQLLLQHIYDHEGVMEQVQWLLSDSSLRNALFMLSPSTATASGINLGETLWKASLRAMKRLQGFPTTVHFTAQSSGSVLAFVVILSIDCRHMEKFPFAEEGSFDASAAERILKKAPGEITCVTTSIEAWVPILEQVTGLYVYCPWRKDAMTEDFTSIMSMMNLQRHREAPQEEWLRNRCLAILRQFFDSVDDEEEDDATSGNFTGLGKDVSHLFCTCFDVVFQHRDTDLLGLYRQHYHRHESCSPRVLYFITFFLRAWSAVAETEIPLLPFLHHTG